MTDEEFRKAMRTCQDNCSDVNNEIIEHLWQLIHLIETEDSEKRIEAATLFQCIMDNIDTVNKYVSQMSCVAIAH